MQKLRIKSGDQVRIMAGKDKGKQGKILQVFPKLHRVVVEGANASKRHLRARKSGEKGQTVEFFMPVDVSNVLPLTPDGKTVRQSRKPKA